MQYLAMLFLGVLLSVSPEIAYSNDSDKKEKKEKESRTLRALDGDFFKETEKKKKPLTETSPRSGKTRYIDYNYENLPEGDEPSLEGACVPGGVESDCEKAKERMLNAKPKKAGPPKPEAVFRVPLNDQ